MLLSPPGTKRPEGLQRWVWLLVEGVGAFSRPFCLQPPTYRNAEHATERTDRNGRPKPDFTNSKSSHTNIVTNIKASNTNSVTNIKMVARCARGKRGLTQVLKNAF